MDAAVKPFSEKRKQAIEFMNSGIKAVAGEPKNPQLGYQLVGSAVELDPTMAHGWFALGNANGDLKLLHASIAAYRRALQLPEGSEIGDLTPEIKAQVLCNMGHTLYHMGKHEEARQRTLEAIEENPKLAFAWINLSMSYSTAGEDEKAIEAARKAHDLDPENATIQVGLAFALMHAKRYAEGLRWFEARVPYKLPQFLSYPYPKWKGQRKAKLFALSDQGIGDTIDFLRFVPEAARRCQHVFLGVQQELVRTCREMFKDYENIEVLALPCPFPAATHWTALMSLPTALHLSDEQIINTPLLPVAVEDVEAPWKVECKKLHVGVAWAGAKQNDVDAWRSTTVENFLELCRVPDVQFYSLQVGERAMDVHNAGAASLFKDVTPYIRDISDTLSILKHLDLVICVDTGLGHICGMVGKECWIATSLNGCDWRFSRHGEESLWYSGHRIVRQGPDADWKPVLERLIEMLSEKVNAAGSD